MNDLEVLEFAKGLVLSEGRKVYAQWKSGGNVEVLKPDNSHVTEFDLKVEAGFKASIQRNFPNDLIVAEESSIGVKPEGVFWTIDPIDGTTFFAHGLFDYSLSLARIIEGEVVLAVTYCPATDELFYATKGGGAFVSQRVWQIDGIEISLLDIEPELFCKLERVEKVEQLHVSAQGVHRESLINIGLDLIRRCRRPGIEEEVIRGTKSHWTAGSTALTIARLAQGKVDQAVHMEQSIWDVAAGKLLVEEAGGLFQRWDNGPLDFTGARANNVYISNGQLSQDWSFLN